MWLIFEGLDKAGKTTLEWELLKQTNYKVNVIDRGPIGYMVFDELFGRSTKLGDNEFVRMAKKINKSDDMLVVHCVVKREAAEDRLREHDETCPYDYSTAQKLMKQRLNRYYDKDHVLLIDTTSQSPEKCAKRIIEWLEDKGALR